MDQKKGEAWDASGQRDDNVGRTDGQPTMPLWKQLLLSLYYHATYPVRVWDYWREVSRDHLPVIVLYYHRIADDRANRWTISNAMFLRQMRWLQERFDFISLDDVQGRIQRGYNPQPCVSITFDDGYADNCRQAIPWLIKQPHSLHLLRHFAERPEG